MDPKDKQKTIRTFALASFLNDFGSDMIYPVWPLFVTTVLGANMAVLGFLDGLGEALVSISQAISGYASDKLRKRKIFVWTGYLCGALSRIGYAFSTAWPHLIPFRVLDRAGKMRGAPRDAILADVSSDEDRGRNFGLVRSMDNLGAVFGIVTCILFIKFLGYRTLFLIAAVPSVISSILIFTSVKEGQSSDKKIFKGLAFKDLNRDFKLFLALSAVFAFGSFSYSFLLIYAKGVGFSAVFLPVLYLIFTVVAAVFSLPFGKLSDRIGRKQVMMLSFLFWAFVCAASILFHNKIAVVAMFILFGLHKAAIEPVQKTFVSELAPAEYRASSLGGFQMVIGLCALPASLIAGLLWDKIGFIIPFYFSLALTILSIIIVMFVKEKNMGR
ncbi:MAG: MFS transporter [Candidatus Omnitrophica bacterium]|nr:MFS transporter [Candidatus Omnitrophota bacterium]